MQPSYETSDSNNIKNTCFMQEHFPRYRYIIRVLAIVGDFVRSIRQGVYPSVSKGRRSCYKPLSVQIS